MRTQQLLDVGAENQNVLYQWTNTIDSSRFDYHAYQSVLQQIQENPMFPLSFSLLETLYDYALHQ